MKRISVITLLVLGVAVLFTVFCEEEWNDSEQTREVLNNPDTPPVENLNFDIIADLDGNPGGAIELWWNPPKGAIPEGYIVETDFNESELLEVRRYQVYEPAGEIHVFADYGLDGRSEPRSLGFKAVETFKIEVWTSNDSSPDHPSGFGFDPDGTAKTYSLYNSDNYPYINFWLYNDNGHPTLMSPHHHDPLINDQVNATDEMEGISYEDMDITSPTGVQLYITMLEISNGGVYSLWVDPDDAGYSDDDNFAKMLVTDLTDQGSGVYKATLKLAYQKTTGLRWVVTNRGYTGIKE